MFLRGVNSGKKVHQNWKNWKMAATALVLQYPLVDIKKYGLVYTKKESRGALVIN